MSDLASHAPELRTERLRLRAWRDEDLAAFAALNADPRVMRYFPAPLSPAQSDAMAARSAERFKADGFGLWAIEAIGECAFAGFVGLAVPSFEASFTPCVEIGWRLAHAAWGRGYATEGARAALDFAFGTLGLPEVVSFTAASNERSRRVMERLGMAFGGGFEHPRLPAGHPLRGHVLYRLAPSGKGESTPERA